MLETTQEAMHVCKQFLAGAADAMPENNYWAFSAYTVLPSELFSYVNQYVLPQWSFSGPMWNYLDAGCSVVAGAIQLADNTTHRPIVTKLKGAVNIANGGQLAALTAINFSLLGGPAFAAAFGVAFLLSLDDVIRESRRALDTKYWIEDSLQQLEKCDQLLDELKKEINHLRDVATKDFRNSNKQSKALEWALKSKQGRLEDLMNKKHELENDLTVIIADKYKNHQKFIRDFPVKKYQTRFYNEHLAQSNDFIVLQGDAPFIKTTKKEIHAKNKANVKQAISNSVILGIAFTGMLLLCIPGMHLPGAIMIGIASTLYLGKNVNKLKNGVVSLYGFFSKKTEPVNDYRYQLANSNMI